MYEFIIYIRINSKRSKDLFVKERTLKTQKKIVLKVKKIFLSRTHTHTKLKATNTLGQELGAPWPSGLTDRPLALAVLPLPSCLYQRVLPCVSQSWLSPLPRWLQRVN